MADPRLSGPARHADDTRRRFLAGILARVPLDGLAEVHLFTPIRQGGTETGVAVVVARRAVEPTVEPTGEVPNDAPPADDASADAPTLDDADDAADGPYRHTIFTARYRMVLRGPDRGQWTVDVVEEADAPLITVAAVVRGVQRRAGDEAAPDRLDAAAVAATVGVYDAASAGP